MSETVDDSSFQKFVLAVMATAGMPVQAEIRTSQEEVEHYWPVLEKGSGPGRRPWPTPRKKTALSRGRIYSRQAVGGFIVKNSKQFFEFLRIAYTRRVAKTKRPLSHAELVDAANEAAAKALNVLTKSIPIDTGKARNSMYLRKAR